MKVVIFCGGFGTRMWPASRKSHPKQFFPLIHGKSFFQITVERFKKMYKPSDIMVSTEEVYLNYVKKQAPEIPSKNLIIEPERKDTLAAVGLVTAVIGKLYPQEVMFFSWSDHIINNEKKFLEAVKAAASYTKETGQPVSVNEKPKFPSTQNGWLQMGETVDEYKGYSIVKIKKFIEKPKLTVAKRMLNAGDYLIHTGYGAWKSDILFSYFEKYVPKMHEGLKKIADAWGTHMEKTELYRQYRTFEKNSVDYGLFEKLENGRYTIAVDVGWRDAGTWQLFYEAFSSPRNPNIVEGSKFKLIDSNGNLIIGPAKKLISVIGLSDVCVIDTKDGLLVCDLSQTGKVKDLFTILEKEDPQFVD